jgi:multiple sugar transport system ATP-binding protein
MPDDGRIQRNILFIKYYFMASVSIEHLSKTYPSAKKNTAPKAISDLNFNVHDKEFMVIVGPSGCGKSTLLRMIAGLEEIDEGYLKIDGKTVNDIAPSERDIAMVFQNYALYPHMTVNNNLAFGLKLRRTPKKVIREQVQHVARLLQLEEVLNSKPGNLSGGQRQRVAIGRAILRRPKVFLFDEPLSNLDAKLRTQMRIELQKLHADINATIIYVTHDQTEAMTLGDRIAVLNKGKLMQIATPLELYNAPENKFVAGFIGSPAMNFIECKLEKKDTHYQLTKNQDICIQLEEDLPSALEKYQDGILTIGIRPEHIIICEPGDPGDLSVRVTGFENMGNEQIIYFLSPEHSFTVRRQAQDEITLNTVRNIRIKRDKIIYFDPVTEKKIF